MMWKANCFPVSERTEIKPNYPYGGMDLNEWAKRNTGNQMQLVFDRSSLHNVVLLRSNQIADDKLQTVCQDSGQNL